MTDRPLVLLDVDGVTRDFPALEDLDWGEQDPEWVLAFWPGPDYGSFWPLRRTGQWELLTVAEYEAGAAARDGWSVSGCQDPYPLLLAAWAKRLLGFPVALEESEHWVRPARRLAWPCRVPLYLVRRNT